MFNWFKKEKPRQFTIRDTLFGDMPLAEWAKDDTDTAEPWGSFVKAKKLLEKGDKTSAAALLQKVAGTPGLESHRYLQVTAASKCWQRTRWAKPSSTLPHS